MQLTLSQLEHHFFDAIKILPSKTNAFEFKEHIFGMMFLKRISDMSEDHYNTSVFDVPEYAQWSYIRDDLHINIGDGLNQALHVLEEANKDIFEGVFQHIDFNYRVGHSCLTDQQFRDLIIHFDRYHLSDEDFEFPGVFGYVYQRLVARFANLAGNKSSELCTPLEITQLMARLVKPQSGQRIYDPCVGSGGMLVQSLQYVRETEDEDAARNMSFYGQENNDSVWSTCKMSMILHGVLDADIRKGDTLVEPKHLDDNGNLLQYDCVLSNPPFNQSYTQKGLIFPERFQHGFTPEKGKKANLMFAQHMLAVLRQPTGVMVTVMPRGVLFRGGVEQMIRKGFVESDVLEAVIDLPLNMFDGTGIPACILVMRAPDGKSLERQDKVLFIDASTEYHVDSDYAKNYLLSEHIEKIVSAYDDFKDIPGFATVVSHDLLEANDYNFNTSCYVDISHSSNDRD